MNNNIVASGLATGCFTGDILDHDLEYIGAPGGSEDNGGKATYETFSKGLFLDNLPTGSPGQILTCFVEESVTIKEFVKLPTTDIDSITELVRDYTYVYIPSISQEKLNQIAFITDNITDVMRSVNEKYSFTTIPEGFIFNPIGGRILNVNGEIITKWVRYDINPIGPILIIERDER